MAEQIHTTGHAAGDTRTMGADARPVTFPLPRTASGITHSMMLSERLRGSTADPVLLQQLDVFWRANSDDEMIAKLREVALDCLSTLPAHSVAGIAAKLAVLLDYAVIPHGTPARGLLLSAFEGAVTLAEMAGSFAVAAGTADPPAAGDAGLLKAWEAYRAAWSAYDGFTGDGNGPEALALWKALEETETALGATVATTPAGAAAQLRVLLAMMPGEQQSGTRAAIEQVITALEAMGGAIAPTCSPALYLQQIGKIKRRHDDRALLDAFDRWQAGQLEFAAAIEQPGPSPSSADAITTTIAEMESFILSAPALTVTGAVAKLIIASLDAAHPGDDELDHILYGTPLPDRSKALWDAIDALRAVFGPVMPALSKKRPAEIEPVDEELRKLLEEINQIQPAEPAHRLRAAARAVVSYNTALDSLKAAAGTDPDIRAEFASMLRRDADGIVDGAAVSGPAAFDAAMALLDAEAAITIPPVPTLEMVEAGAVAAGIDADSARAVFTAMVQTHQRRAA